jgi:hypothetical protein
LCYEAFYSRVRASCTIETSIKLADCCLGRSADATSGDDLPIHTL